MAERARDQERQRSTDASRPGEADNRDPGAPTPEELLAQGKDPAWPIPGLATNDTEADSPASDADAPAPG
ncbi:MAG: hypothetical protein AB7W59_22260 [Acidimicrobiia bacterium]